MDAKYDKSDGDGGVALHQFSVTMPATSLAWEALRLAKDFERGKTGTSVTYQLAAWVMVGRVLCSRRSARSVDCPNIRTTDTCLNSSFSSTDASLYH